MFSEFSEQFSMLIQMSSFCKLPKDKRNKKIEDWTQTNWHLPPSSPHLSPHVFTYPPESELHFYLYAIGENDCTVLLNELSEDTL
jgi:hypothetical protein